MEALTNILQPYKDIVGTITGLVTSAQMFAGVFICKDIYKKGNTEGVPFMPFTGGFVMSLVSLKYATILRDDTMLQCNLVGLALNVLYIMFYFNYSQEKIKVWAYIGAAGTISGALLGYAEYEDPQLVEHRFGLILTVLIFYLISAPLFNLNEIIKTQSTEGLPFPMILSGTVVTFMWMLYGIILRNNFLIIQNIVAFAICSSQLSLFVIYPSKPKKPKAKKID